MIGHWLARLWVVQGWVVAALWCWRGFGTAVGLPKVTNLLDTGYDATASDGPILTVIVPAKDEAANVEGCLRSLMGQEYRSLRVVAVNDRSTDGTGAIMDRLAAEYPERLRVMHVTELPEGWLGKTHAMAMAAKATESEYLLFTDADIVYRTDALRRSMAYAVASGADHLVTLPTLVLKRWDEAALLGFFQVCAMWASRPWKVADARAKRDAVGVGAFNLIRRSAYEQVGGFEALRMEIVEDLGIARRVKRAGLRQRVAFGRDLVSVHWAAGAVGVVNVLTKNMFFGVRVPDMEAAGGLRVAGGVLRAAVRGAGGAGDVRAGVCDGGGDGGGVPGDWEVLGDSGVECAAGSVCSFVIDLCAAAVDGDDVAAGWGGLARDVLFVAGVAAQCGSIVVTFLKER